MENSTWLSQRTSCRQTHRWWWSKGWLVPFKQWVAPTWELKWNPKRAGWSHPSAVPPNNIVMQPSQKCKPECKLWVPLGTQFLLISVGIRLLICRSLSGICHWILLSLPSKSRENLFYYTVSDSIPCQEKGGKTRPVLLRHDSCSFCKEITTEPAQKDISLCLGFNNMWQHWLVTTTLS